MLESILCRTLPLVAFVGIACGSDSPSSPSCAADTDCKGDRVCVEGKCEGYSGSDRGDYSNSCGDSPVYGKFLVKIEDCDTSFHFREDCVVGRAIIENTYEGSALDQPLDNFDYGVGIRYNGLVLSTSSQDVSLDPSMRFIDGSSQDSSWRRVNEILDQYDGYVLRHCTQDNIDDCVYVALSNPLKTLAECKSSPYYVGQD